MISRFVKNKYDAIQHACMGTAVICVITHTFIHVARVESIALGLALLSGVVSFAAYLVNQLTVNQLR